MSPNSDSAPGRMTYSSARATPMTAIIARSADTMREYGMRALRPAVANRTSPRRQTDAPRRKDPPADRDPAGVRSVPAMRSQCAALTPVGSQRRAHGSSEVGVRLGAVGRLAVEEVDDPLVGRVAGIGRRRQHERRDRRPEHRLLDAGSADPTSGG